MILAPHGHLSHLAGRGLANRRWPRWARRASHDAWNLCTLSARPRSRRCRPARHSVRWPAVSSLSGRVVASFPRRSSASLGLDSVLTRKYRIGRTSRRRAGAGDARRRGERHRRRHLLGPAILVVVALASMVRVLQEYERAVIFRLGNVLRAPKGPGLFLILPFGIDRMRKVNLQTVAMNVPPQDVITRDNVTLRVDAVVYSRVVDPVKAVVEIKDVDLPEELQRAMAREAEASRDAKALKISADAELMASHVLSEAAGIMSQNPSSLQLRFLQTVAEVATERNSTLVMPIPIELLSFFGRVGDLAGTLGNGGPPAVNAPRAPSSPQAPADEPAAGSPTAQFPPVPPDGAAPPDGTTPPPRPPRRP